MDIAQVLAIWLHTVAFVIAWGYYGVLGRIVLPSLARSLELPAQAATLAAIERRALPLIIVSLVLFTLTGTYLLVSAPQYAGLGNLFETRWTTLILVKHVLVLTLAVLGVVVDRLVRRAAAAASDAARESDLRRAALSADGATLMGALVALVTVIAQVGG